jgi:hypothetical protein
MAGALHRGDTLPVTEFLISLRRQPGLLAVELRAWLGSHGRRFDAISGNLSCRPDATVVNSTNALRLSIRLPEDPVASRHAAITELVADMRLLGLRLVVLGDREVPMPALVANHA